MAQLLTPFAGRQRSDAIAATLIANFGTIGAALRASREALVRALPEDSDVAEMLCSARALVEVGQRELIIGQPIDADEIALHRFLRMRLSGVEERLLVIYLDRQSCPIRDEIAAVGNRSGLSVRSAAIIRRAFELEASGMILAHNHPSGEVKPSAQDVQATRDFHHVARTLEIHLVDHIIVTTTRTYSMRKAGQLCP